LDLETGILEDEDTLKELNNLFKERTDKIENCAIAYKCLLAEEKAFADEIKSLQQKQKQLKNKAAWLKDYIAYNMQNGEELESTKFKISWRASKRCYLKKNFCDPSDLPEEYKRIKIEANFEALKKLCKQEENEYAYLDEINNIQIK
jgi:hypothetical protein